MVHLKMQSFPTLQNPFAFLYMFLCTLEKILDILILHILVKREKKEFFN